MYEMLRALKALDATDIAAFSNALASVRLAVNAPRIEYALAVVQTHRLPATAPSGLPPDQIAAARDWLDNPFSILRELVPKSRLPAINVSLTSPSNAFILDVLGAPRKDYSTQYQPVTNPVLLRRMETANIGPLRVSGLNSALTSLRSVMAMVQNQQRLVYRSLGTQGMLNPRLSTGSKTAISNHAWGTAVDLTIEGQLDRRGDNQVLFGLLLIAPIFNAQGWYWGAGFPTEDGMHFEAGKDLVRGWKSAT